MRHLVALVGLLAASAMPAAAQTAPGQSTPTAAPSSNKATAQPGRVPTPARPSVRQSRNFFGLPLLLPLLGLGGAGAALAASGGGGNGGATAPPPASPQ